MGRPLRAQIPDGLYHLTSRGNRGEAIFTDSRDLARFLELVGRVVPRFEWRCHSYCLIPNHYHLVVETPQGNVSAGMHWLNGTYARWFNWRHAYEGHLFQRRFRSTLIETDAHLLEVFRYVALNPVRAGLCQHPASWRWSSCPATLGRAARPSFLSVDWLLEHFGADRDQARDVFERFVLSPADFAESYLAA